jgi:hypothetical protein
LVIARNKLLWLVTAICVGCKAEGRAPAPDSTTSAVATDALSAAPTPNSYESLAGDTLDLVSVGGKALPQPGGAGLACDSAHTPVRQQLVLSADTTYWALTVARPGCRDTVITESDTLRTRGWYAISGDTIFIRFAGPKVDTELSGLIFPDSIVQVGTTSDRIWRFSRRQGAAVNPAEAGDRRTDSTFLARDIDGSGKTDYVVRESRPEATSMLSNEYRVAVYLDSEPQSRPPNWSNDWDMEVGRQQGLSKSFAISSAASLLDVEWSGGDFDGDNILIAERGKIRREIYHGIDYGHGYLFARQENGKSVVEASLDNLELLGKPVTSEIKCPATQIPAMRLVFDPKAGHFVTDRALCSKPEPDNGT